MVYRVAAAKFKLRKAGHQLPKHIGSGGHADQRNVELRNYLQMHILNNPSVVSRRLAGLLVTNSPKFSSYAL